MEPKKQVRMYFFILQHIRNSLISGNVKGNFSLLFETISKIQAAKGVFDCLFCVGETLSLEFASDLYEYISGKKKAPIDTYFIDSSECIGPFMHTRREGMQIAPGISFLGREGIKEIKGLQVAFLSGKDMKPHEEKDLKVKDPEQLYTNNCFILNDIEEVIKKSKEKNVDLLLACGWPYDIHKYTEYILNLIGEKYRMNIPQQDVYKSMSCKLKTLCNSICPRYMFCSGPVPNKYFNRAPYKNHKKYTTKIIALSSVEKKMTAKDDRYLFALEITPISQMSVAELTNVVESECTANPFEEAPEEKVPEVQGFEDCWFCYENPKLEKHLILFEYPSTYIAMPKGPIVQHHFLILPKQHFPSMIQCPPGILKEFEIAIGNLIKYLNWMNEDYILFERFIKTTRPNGMHLNLQLVGVPQKFSTTLRDHFEKFSQKRKIPIQDVTQTVPNFFSLKSLIKDKDAEYFYLEFPDLKTAKGRTKGKMLYISGKNDRGIAPQIGREFICGLLDLHDRIDWRKCRMNNEDEERLVNALKENIAKAGIGF